ncbi:hydrogenase nickel incorporation protein HypB [Nguyenibacter vanlangensis]|uniref:Hydrogenase maturation factor HypB n=1 Tax=Nguyenibacter vanlangensis TaxID=1216886 RepID=A0ABZ3D9A2_9PROT
MAHREGHAHQHHDGGCLDFRSGLDFGSGDVGPDSAHAHAPGVGKERAIRIERDILAANDAFAAANRARLLQQGSFALNIVSSPGAGKTSLLVRLVEHIRTFLPVAVIEGDQQTSRDAERIRATGAAAVQVNTGKGCHLDAHMVSHAMDMLPTPQNGVLFIENVGNLVCPAAFDLGERSRMVVLSVTEGEDKPLKYPHIFSSSHLMVLNKIDLLPHLDFDRDACIAAARRVNPHLQILEVSARTGAGLNELAGWVMQCRPAAVPDGPDHAYPARR